MVDITKQLYADGAIRSPRTFDIFMRLMGSDTHVSEGEYSFDHPLSSLAMAMRFSGKEFGISKNKVTFPEGFTNTEMAAHLHEIFPEFDGTQFLSLAAAKEGYLFPDTYGFFPTPLPQAVVTAMQEDYETKVAPLRPSIAQSGHSEHDIIVMASLIEKEAHGDNDRAIIAGILWNRIHNGMRLQVDAATVTYSKAGLPANPICNPGLAAIKAAIDPQSSDYLYYLHDASGAIHYASTFNQHEQNIKKYLK